jgi:hypothetical protein
MLSASQRLLDGQKHAPYCSPPYIRHSRVQLLRVTHRLHPSGLELTMFATRIWRCIDYLHLLLLTATLRCTTFMCPAARAMPTQNQPLPTIFSYLAPCLRCLDWWPQRRTPPASAACPNLVASTSAPEPFAVPSVVTLSARVASVRAQDAAQPVNHLRPRKSCHP